MKPVRIRARAGGLIGALMRISDLSRQTGVPIATIKFYLREGLLPPGTPTGRNQADYGEAHLRRLRLIRTFAGIGQLDLSSIRQLVRSIEDDGLSLSDLYAVVNRTVWPVVPEPADAALAKACRDDVDEFLGRIGWQVDIDAPGYGRLSAALVALRALGCECGIDFFTPYADAAQRLMEQELDLLPAEVRGSDRAAAVVRTILLEIALAAMGRMAQEHLLARRLSPPAPQAEVA
jgi:DNA-binding transcriptional MerR regulator